MNMYLVYHRLYTTPVFIIPLTWTTLSAKFLIRNRVSNQKQNAVNILNNRERYEAIVSECDKILGSINYKEPSKPAPEFEEFKAYMGNVDVRLNRSEALLEKIAEELGLFKDK